MQNEQTERKIKHLLCFSVTRRRTKVRREAKFVYSIKLKFYPYFVFLSFLNFCFSFFLPVSLFFSFYALCTFFTSPLWQTERNAGRFGDFFLVSVVTYGRGKNSPKADVAGICPPFLCQMITSRNICFYRSVSTHICVIPSLSSV